MWKQQQGLSGIFVMSSVRRDITGNILNYIFYLLIAYLTTLLIAHVTRTSNCKINCIYGIEKGSEGSGRGLI